MRNPGTRAVLVRKVDTGCRCLRVGLRSFSLEPGATTAVPLTLDLKDDSGFRGLLSIPVIGVGQVGETIFGTTVEVQVKG